MNQSQKGKQQILLITMNELKILNELNWGGGYVCMPTYTTVRKQDRHHCDELCRIKLTNRH